MKHKIGTYEDTEEFKKLNFLKMELAACILQRAWKNFKLKKSS